LTERLILEHIYGVPLAREKRRYKFKDIDKDNLDQNAEKKWKKIKQNILNFDDFVDTVNFLKNGRLSQAQNIDQTEVTKNQLKLYFEQIYKEDEYFEERLSDTNCLIDLNKKMTQKKKILLKK
jgi:hypothetical protein